MVGFFDHGTESSRSIICGKFLDQLKNYKLFKEFYLPVY